MKIYSQSLFWLKRGSAYILGTWNHKIQRVFKSLSPENVTKSSYPICNAELDALQKTISCDRSLVHFDWWIFDLGITWGWPAALMRSHLPLLGARSAAATVQLQSMSPWGWLMSITKQKDKKQMRLLCAGTETGTELLGHWTELPAVAVWDHTLGYRKFIFIAAPSRATQEWEKMMEGTVSSGQSSWEITEIPKLLQNILLYYISLGLFRPVSVLIPKSHGFSPQENCSPTFLKDTSAVTDKWRKNSLDNKIVAKPVAQAETQSQKSLICTTDNYLYISFLLYLL